MSVRFTAIGKRLAMMVTLRENVSRPFVVANAKKFGVSKVSMLGPFHERHLHDELGLDRAAFRHLFLSEAFPPAAGRRLWKILKRALWFRAVQVLRKAPAGCVV